MASPTPTSLAATIRWQATQRPRADALIAPGRSSNTYAALAQQFDVAAARLLDAGITRGDTVAVALPDGLDSALTVLAVSSHTACAPLPVTYLSTDAEEALRLLCPAAVVVADAAGSAVHDAARRLGLRLLTLDDLLGRPASATPTVSPAASPAAPEPADVMLVLRTSGTAGQPKIVRLTHRHVLAASRAIVDVLDLVPEDRCLSVMPLAHIHGLSALFASLASGGSVVCPPPFSAPDALTHIAAFGPTWYTAAPAVHRALLDEARRRSDGAAGTLRFARSASAPLPVPLAEEFERVLGIPIIEAYGMTEASPQIASNRRPPHPRTPGSVGRPAGPDVLILAEDGSTCEAGTTGEIAIRGDNVCADGWLRTGDLGRVDADGNLFVTGRLSDVINRGGEKIDPTAIETVALQHDAVVDAAAFAVPHATLGSAIAMMVVLRPEAAVAAAAIRAHIAARLAPAKVPQTLLVVDTIPREGGKLRRSLLAGLAARLEADAASGRQAAGTSWASHAETLVARAFADVLPDVPFGPHDNFFARGGDSLSATHVRLRLAERGGVDLPVDAVFRWPTVTELAAQIEIGARAVEDIPRRPDPGRAPLSPGQQRLWLLDRMDPGRIDYTMQFAVQLDGALDAAALADAIAAVRREHEVLRTSFPIVDGAPVQRVHEPAAECLASIDLTIVGVDRRAGELRRIAADEAATPFNLARGPLFRPRLFRLAPMCHVLLVSVHHAVFDGWSTAIFVHELGRHYTAIAAGGRLPASAPLQYGDVAAWQAGRGAVQDAAAESWRAVLHDARRTIALPFSTGADGTAPAGARLETCLDASVVARLRAVGLEHGATLSTTLLAAFQLLLYRYSGQEDFTVGMPVAARTHPHMEHMIGFFANTVVVRADLSGAPTFRDVLDRVQRSTRHAFANQDVPFDRVVDALRPPRTMTGAPLFEVMFAFQNVPGWSGPFAPGLNAAPFRTDVVDAKFALTLYVRETDDGLHLGWQHRMDRLDAPTVARMAASFTALLDAVTHTPDLRVGAVGLAPHARQPEAAAVDAGPSVLERWRTRVRTDPGSIAVIDAERTLTCADLDARAQAWAAALTARGGLAGTPVAAGMSRSSDALAVLLGIWMAGAVYVPVDPSQPPSRVADLLDAARVAVIVTDVPASFGACAGGRPIVTTPGNPGVRTARAADPLDQDATAYVIHTSGTLGTPRAVRISHRNVSHYVASMLEALTIVRGDCWLHTASFVFSSSVRQFLVPLAAGVPIVMASAEEVRDPFRLLARARDTAVTIVDWIPSYWARVSQLLASADPGLRAGVLDNRLRLILSASEPLTWTHVRNWRKLGHPARIVNMYGTTETTGIVALGVVADDETQDGQVPAGRPLAGVTLAVLDERGCVVPDGVVGELWVGGATVGRTDVAAPFGASGHRTGDRGRRRPDGSFEILGRLDSQVKVRGMRVEPAEVEAVVRRHPQVLDVVVHPYGPGGHEGLAAVVMPVDGPGDEGGDLPSVLRRWLLDHLPAYMVPTRIAVAPDLPRTATGKVDRSAVTAAPSSAAPPATTTDDRHAEAILRSLWMRLLGRPSIDADDNFFDLGGDSLLGLQMIDEANGAGLRLMPAQLFRFQTLAALSRAASADGARTGQPASRLSAVGDDGALRPLAPIAEAMRVTIDSARAFGIEALTRAGLDAASAAAFTEVQVEASLRGQPTHNIGAIPRYARRLRSGVINATPHVRVEHESATSALIDADHAAGQLVAGMAMNLALDKAVRTGIGVVGVRRSNHFGAAGHYVWQAATRGMIGLCTTNSALWLAPTGGLTPLFGTNPLGVGVPSLRHLPIVLDMSMSVIAKGKVALQLAEGRPLEAGWVMDRTGRTSIDPAALVAGLGIPIGGHKGYGLALTMEILAGVLTGAGFASDHHRDHLKQAGARPDFGHFFLAIDPGLFGPASAFFARVDRLIDEVKHAERIEGVDEILLPGEAELRARARNLVDGLPILPSVHRTIDAYCTEAALTSRLVPVEALSHR